MLLGSAAEPAVSAERRAGSCLVQFVDATPRLLQHRQVDLRRSAAATEESKSRAQAKPIGPNDKGVVNSSALRLRKPPVVEKACPWGRLVVAT